MGIFTDTRTCHLQPSLQLQIINIILCVVLTIFVFSVLRKRAAFAPITLEALWQICLAETNRRKSKRRVRELKAQMNSDDLEKKAITRYRCLASVVGYREDPVLFEKCLRSYANVDGLECLLVGIDGDSPQDCEMANITGKVFGDAAFIHLDEPLAIEAVRLAEQYVLRELDQHKYFELPEDWTFDDLPEDLRKRADAHAMDQVHAKASKILEEHEVLHSTEGSFRVICISEPHMNKKAILFTNLVMSTVLGETNLCPYLYSGDSDTWITPETIPTIVGVMAADPKVGGSCSLLGIHNAHEGLVAQLGCAIYFSEIPITRGQTGALDAADCQPGPCAAFLLEALSPNLFSWYTQTSMGVKTVVNEDRHLTTKLLLDGWKVTFNTEAIAYTDTPTTLLRWLLQQLRWARATQIETFQYPKIYAVHGPIFYLSAMNRFYGPMSLMVLTIRYVFFGHVVRAYSLYDVLARMLLVTGYNLICYRQHAVNSAIFLAFSQIFYQLPLPGMIVYASMTALEGGWGTAMRSQKEVQKTKGAGWDHLRAITAIVVWLGLVAAALARWLATSFMPGLTTPLMAVSACFTMSTLYYSLLQRSQTA